jgi:hypothetical protein
VAKLQKTLRRQSGEKYDAKKVRNTRSLTMAVRPKAAATAKIGPYDASVVKNPASSCRLATVRPECGNLAANYDASAAIRQKTLRRQFDQKYDAKKIRNM